MKKVQAIIDFTYSKYNKIENLKSVNKKEKGKIFNGDIFEVEDTEVKYLTGENEKKLVAVKVLEEKEETKEITKKTKKKIEKKKDDK